MPAVSAVRSLVAVALRVSAALVSVPLALVGRARRGRPVTAISPFEAYSGGDLSGGAGADLPVEDFEHVTLASLRARLPSLSLPDVRALQAYETAHAARLPVLTMLDNRIAKLARDGN